MLNKFLLSGLIVLAANFAHAQESETRGYLTSTPAAGERWTGWAPFVGLDAGYTAYSSHLDIEGVPSSAKILGSYVVPSTDFVFDGGLGFENQSFSQQAAADRYLQSTVLELAARYQWQNRWQAGLVWNTMFNDGKYYGANQADLQLAGLQVMKEFNLQQEWIMRVGGRYMTDVNINGTWLNQVMVDVQLGWNSTRKTSVPAVTETSPAAPLDMAQESTIDPVSTTVPEQHFPSGFSATKEREDVWAHRDFLLFSVSSAGLDNKDTKRLHRLAAVLKTNPGLVKKLEVVGYADPTGPKSFNQKLSAKRAETVKRDLVKNGVKAKSIHVVARGESNPVPGSLEKSRRVEVHFHDVRDPEALKELIHSIQ